MACPNVIAPRVLSERMGSLDRPVLLDVREPFEHETCALPGSVLIPLGELPTRLDELNPTLPTVVYCHHGIRSLSGAVILQNAGFADVSSLSGGIERWAQEVDPSMPRY
jgi:rhodanese-related sulfurtransferase